MFLQFVQLFAHNKIKFTQDSRGLLSVFCFIFITLCGNIFFSHSLSQTLNTPHSLQIYLYKQTTQKKKHLSLQNKIETDCSKPHRQTRPFATIVYWRLTLISTSQLYCGWVFFTFVSYEWFAVPVCLSVYMYACFLIRVCVLVFLYWLCFNVCIFIWNCFGVFVLVSVFVCECIPQEKQWILDVSQVCKRECNRVYERTRGSELHQPMMNWTFEVFQQHQFTLNFCSLRESQKHLRQNMNVHSSTFSVAKSVLYQFRKLMI